MTSRRETDPEQKLEAVMALLRGEESSSDIMNRLDVSEATLFLWYEEFIAGGKRALLQVGKAVNSSNSITQLDSAIEELERAIGKISDAHGTMKNKRIIDSRNN